MILFIISFISSSLLLILSYKQYIVYKNKFTIIMIPGINNFMLGFSFMFWILENRPELIIISILTGFISFLLLTSIVINKNEIHKETEDACFLGKTALITDFIVKAHRYYVYIGNIDGFVIFIYSNHQLELNSYVTLTNYNNDKYFV